MMGGEAPETCRATHKLQVINLWNCWILLVYLFESYDNERTCERQTSLVIRRANAVILITYFLIFLLLPTWYTNFLFIYTNYIKLNSSTCFERNPLIIRRSTTQNIHMQPLVLPLSASDRLVQPLSAYTRRSLADSDDTRGCICTFCVVDLLMMSGLRSKHVEEFNFM
jgi:hypothetical protein